MAAARTPAKLMRALGLEASTGTSTPAFDRTHLHPVKLDVTQPLAEINSIVAEALSVWGRIDVLVNNAGVGFMSVTEEAGCVCPTRLFATDTLMSGRSDGMRMTLPTNLLGVMNMTNAVLPHMRERGQGTIVVVGSRSAWRSELPVCRPPALCRS